MTSDNSHQLSWFAMGTEWQLKIHSDRSESYLISVGEAVQLEVERVEQLLSFYRDTSDLCELNAFASARPVVVDPRIFALLEQVELLYAATDGGFDPTIGPLLRCWGFVGNTGSMPRAREIEAARAVVGLHHVELEAKARTVRYDRDGVELEFGAIGKGYAIERAVELLREEYQIESALLHGGTSTIHGIGAPPDAESWLVAIQRPYASQGDTILTVPLRDSAVSVSAPHGKWFEQDGKKYGHVLDPRTGYPAAGGVLAVVATESATESDALSTGLLVLGEDGMAKIRAFRPDAFALLGTHETDGELCLITDGDVVSGTGTPPFPVQ